MKLLSAAGAGVIVVVASYTYRSSGTRAPHFLLDPFFFLARRCARFSLPRNGHSHARHRGTRARHLRTRFSARDSAQYFKLRAGGVIVDFCPPFNNKPLFARHMAGERAADITIAAMRECGSCLLGSTTRFSHFRHVLDFRPLQRPAVVYFPRFFRALFGPQSSAPRTNEWSRISSFQRARQVAATIFFQLPSIESALEKPICLFARSVIESNEIASASGF